MIRTIFSDNLFNQDTPIIWRNRPLSSAAVYCITCMLVMQYTDKSRGKAKTGAVVQTSKETCGFKTTSNVRALCATLPLFSDFPDASGAAEGSGLVLRLDPSSGLKCVYNRTIDTIITMLINTH